MSALRESVEGAHAAYEAALSSGASDEAIVALEQAAQAAEQAYEEALAAEVPTATGGAAAVPAEQGVESVPEAAAGGMWSEFKTLESLSWCVDESGALRPLDAGDCKARRVDQLVLLNAATRHVQETLIDTHGFSAIPLPLDGGGPVVVGQRCTVFASENWTTAEKLLIVVQPMSGQRRGRSRGGGALPGIWSRGLLLDRGMHGSMLALVEGARADGWGVILCDPNTPSEGNESPEAHMAYVWERLVLASAAASDIAFLAFSNGGKIVKSLLTAHEGTILPRCRALALIESSHRLVGELSLALEPAESKGLVRFLQKRTVNWQCIDPAAVGRAVPQLARVPEIEEQLGCVTLSAVPAENLDAALRNIGALILFPVTFHANPADNLTLLVPPDYLTFMPTFIYDCHAPQLQPLRSTSRCPRSCDSSVHPSRGASARSCLRTRTLRRTVPRRPRRRAPRSSPRPRPARRGTERSPESSYPAFSPGSTSRSATKKPLRPSRTARRPGRQRRPPPRQSPQRAARAPASL